MANKYAQQQRRHKKGLNLRYNECYIEWLHNLIIDMRKDWYTICQIREHLINEYWNLRGFSISNIWKISKTNWINLYNWGEESVGSGNFTRINRNTKQYKYI